MLFSAQVSLALATLASAAPLLQKRQAVTDAGILNYALTLEHLEDKFYRDGLKNFTADDFTAAGFAPAFYTNLKEISFDETTHVSFLTSALTAAGAVPVKECTYNFGVTDVASFVGLASVLEGVGVSAYLGAAASISTKAYLTAAAAILTVESRHNAYIRYALKKSPFAQPFDAPLGFNEVYTLAKSFIISCPSDNPAFLPLVAFPTLSAAVAGPARKRSDVGVFSSGSKITLTVTKINDKVAKRGGGSYGAPAAPAPPPPTPKAKVWAAWAAVTGSVFVEADEVSPGVYTTTIPDGFHGQSYVVLTTSGTDSSDGNIIAGPAIVEISGTTGSP